MSIPNWPPPNLVVSYCVTCGANSVYRVEDIQVLEGEPDIAGRELMFIDGSDALLVALRSLGVEPGGAWMGFYESVGDATTRFTTWAA